MIKRLETLQNNKYVKEYIALSEELGSVDVSYFKNNARDDDVLLRHLFYKACGDSKTNNGIYVYLGTYKSDPNLWNPEIQVDRDDEESTYSKYWNIESDLYGVVDIGKRKEFENNHKIIYPDENYVSRGTVAFSRIQTEFARDLIDYGQEEAVKRVLAKSRKIK